MHLRERVNIADLLAVFLQERSIEAVGEFEALRRPIPRPLMKTPGLGMTAFNSCLSPLMTRIRGPFCTPV
jgi:hypothetical protein